MTEIAYIYTLSDPETNEVRYVGKTCNLKRRLFEHNAYKDRNSYKEHWVKNLHSRNLKPVMVVVASFAQESYEEWQEAERYWISHFRSLGNKLTNLASGGESGSNHSEESKQKISIGNKGKKRSPEDIEKVRIKLIGQKRSDEVVQKMSEKAKQMWQGEEYRKKAEKHIADMGRARKGIVVSEETRKKLSISATGRKYSEEANQKNRERGLGRKFTEEGLKNVREASKKRWQNYESKPGSPKLIEALNSNRAIRWAQPGAKEEHSKKMKAYWDDIRANPEKMAEKKKNISNGKNKSNQNSLEEIEVFDQLDPSVSEI